MNSVKAFVVSLILATFALGQGSYTVYQKLVTDGAQNNVLFGPVNNIGQSAHQFTVVWKDAIAQTCDQPRAALTPGADAYFEAINLNAPANLDTQSKMPLFVTSSYVGLGTSNIRWTRTYIGTGVNPFTYVRFQGVNFTKCRVDVYYSGSLNTFFNNPVVGSLFSNSSDSLRTITNSITTGNSSDIVGAAASSFPRYSLYGIVLSNQGAASTGDITISEIYPDASTAVLETYRLPANGNLTVMPGNFPIATTETSSGLRITNQSGQTITFTAWYKGE